MREIFVEKRFSADSRALIDRANTIIHEYQSQGFVLTLRQLYYQFVARALIPNQQKEYERLGALISAARLAGLIDWEAIEDRTRMLRKPATWDSPYAIVEACASQYKEDLWAAQPYYIEVWIEKDALLGVVEPACEQLRLPYFACRGYSSQSAQYEAGKRFLHAADCGQRILVIHLGDHDPSGIDMSRDNRDRLMMFLGEQAEQIELLRIALNRDQVDEHKPPPNPTKLTDSRANGYISEHGNSCWELDALDPRVIDSLVRSAVEPYIDQANWKTALEQEKTHRASIKRLLAQL